MCVLHVTSESVSFSAYVARSALPVYRSHEKGDTLGRGKRKPYQDYGFSCVVSEREWTDLSGQIEDAATFLRQYEIELQKLIATHPVDDIRLDFPYSCRLDERIFAQFDYLPPEFLKMAGSLGIGIELSHYPASEADGDSEQIVPPDRR
jgi:hypothetical protein